MRSKSNKREKIVFLILIYVFTIGNTKFFFLIIKGDSCPHNVSFFRIYSFRILIKKIMAGYHHDPTHNFHGTHFLFLFGPSQTPIIINLDYRYLC